MAFGRWKIQFCQAVRRPKILVSMVSGPAKRRLASMPVSPSAEKEARSSRKMRTSSSQSIAVLGLERAVERGARRIDARRLAQEAGRQPREAVAHGIGAEVEGRQG